MFEPVQQQVASHSALLHADGLFFNVLRQVSADVWAETLGSMNRAAGRQALANIRGHLAQQLKITIADQLRSDSEGR